MCSLCGSLGTGPAWENESRAGDADARWRLRRDAAAAAAVLTQHLASRRIRIDAHPDFGFLVQFPTGGTEVAASVMDVWHRLDAAKVPLPDPLEV